MAEDRKFRFDPETGQFVNRVSGESIPHDEPVIIFRARDVHALAVLHFYLNLVEDPHHSQAILERIEEFMVFHRLNPSRMKDPGITHDIELHREQEDRNEMSEREAELHHWGGGHHHHPATTEERVEALEHRDDSLEERMTNIMADIDELNSVLAGIGDDASTLTADFKNLEAELQAAQEAAANNQPIDLSNSILLARNAQAALDAIVAAAGAAAGSGGSVTPPPPPPPPPVEEDLLSLGGEQLPDATVGSAYTGMLSIAGGTAPYSVNSSPQSDNGLTINADGSVSGTASAAGTSTFNVVVTDSATPPNSVSGPVVLNAVDATI